jgi:hypothetical protein
MIQPHPPLIILILGAKYHYATPYNQHFLLSSGPQQEQLCNKTHDKIICDLRPEEENI